MSKKGPQWEREFSRSLSLWWTDGERDDVFWRTQTSGGRATQRAKKGQETAYQHGDITATDPIGYPLVKKVLFELKRGYEKGYTGNTLHDLLDRNHSSAPGLFDKWIHGVNAKRHKHAILHWAIVSKRDRKEPIITVDYGLACKLNLTRGSFPVVQTHYQSKISGSLEYAASITLQDFFSRSGKEFFI
jgi:hypothetical protein